MAAVARAGMQVLPILFTPPPFRAHGRAGARHLPARRSGGHGDFADTAGAPVRARRQLLEARTRTCRRTRSGPGRSGTSRTCPSTGRAGPDPRQYVELLASVSKAIKRADPSAAVVSAGLSESSRGMPFDDFVDGMFEAGRRRLPRRIRAPRLRARRAGLGRRGRACARAAHGAGLEGADLGHRDRLGERRAGEPFHRRARGQAERIRAALDALFTPPRMSSACTGSSTSTGETPRCTRAGRTSSACTPGCSA